MTVSPELMQQVAIWRQKAADGTLTQEEMRNAVIVLRENRHSATKAAAISMKGKKAKEPTKSAEDLLKEFGL